MTDQRGIEFVVDCLRARFASGDWLQPVAATDVVDHAIRIASDNKVLFLVAPSLRGAAIIERLNREKFLIIFKSEKLLSETIIISKLFSERGIRYVVIKGPLWQHEIYADFFVRPASDIDILVRRKDFARARSALLEVGYRLRSTSIWWSAFLGEQSLVKIGPPRVAVDLHHRLTQPGVPASIQPETLFASADATAYRGSQIPVLSPADATRLGLIGLSKALYNREPAGSYVCDLYVVLMADLPAAAVSFVAMASEQRLEGVARVALQAMAAVFDIDLGLDRGIGSSLCALSRRDWQALIFTPRAPGTKWPRRRDFVWAFCSREPLRFAREVARVVASEVTRRLFERGPAAPPG